MEIFEDFIAIKNRLDLIKKSGKTIGFFSFSGGLHQGHLSILDKTLLENDITLVHYFDINQLGPVQGMAFPYPASLQDDQKILSEKKVDFLFIMNEKNIGKNIINWKLKIDPDFTSLAAGITRPKLMRNLGPIMVSLFPYIRADRAYMGLKDYQQNKIVYEFVKKYLGNAVQLIFCPIIREKDGLACSSSNAFLTPAERNSAVQLYYSLLGAKEIIKNGENKCSYIKEVILQHLLKFSKLKIEYIEIVMRDTFKRTEYIVPDQQIILVEALIQSEKAGQTLKIIDNIFI